MSEYYKNGGLVYPSDYAPSVPYNGPIRIHQFYGAQRIRSASYAFDYNMGNQVQSVVFGPMSTYGFNTFSLNVYFQQTSGSEPHSNALVQYSFDGGNYATWFSVGGYCWNNCDPHFRGWNAVGQSASLGVSGNSNIWLRLYTWAERGDANVRIWGDCTISV